MPTLIQCRTGNFVRFPLFSWLMSSRTEDSARPLLPSSRYVTLLPRQIRLPMSYGPSSPSGLTSSSSIGFYFALSKRQSICPGPSNISSYSQPLNATTVHVNSLLAVLNTREILRKRTAGMATIPQSPESIQPHKMNFIRTSSILPSQSPSGFESPSSIQAQNVGGSLTDLSIFCYSIDQVHMPGEVECLIPRFDYLFNIELCHVTFYFHLRRLIL